MTITSTLIRWSRASNRRRAVELALRPLGVLLAQHVEAHLLPGQERAGVVGAVGNVRLVHEIRLGTGGPGLER